jgi:hypothetical protein
MNPQRRSIASWTKWRATTPDTKAEGSMAKDERAALVESIKSMEDIVRNLENVAEREGKGGFGHARLRDARQTLRERKAALKRFDEKNGVKR